MKPREKIYLIDTNVILRYLLGDHSALSPRAEAFMVKVSQGRCKAEVAAVVIVECVYVMEKYYKIPKGEIVGTLGRLMNFRGIVNSDKGEILDALLKYEDSSADIVDCLLAAESSPAKVVVSFDKDLERLKAVCEAI